MHSCCRNPRENGKSFLKESDFVRTFYSSGCMCVSRIIYNPNLSVEDNARQNSVTPAAIRYYINVNHIDRRADRKIKIISVCRKYFASHPEASKSEVARGTKYSLYSVRKYWEYIVSDKEFADFDRNKSKERHYLKGMPAKLKRAKDKDDWKSSVEIELKKLIDEYIAKEHQNILRLEQIELPQQKICKADILKEEQYDAAGNLCYAFRKREDLHKDAYIPFGNMNGGFPYEIQGLTFNQSEGAYISGMFSNNTPEHLAIQRELAAAKSGMYAKKGVRYRYQYAARDDWNDFNVEWMLYCVWMKCKGNVEFRNLLLAVPREAIIIEDTTFKPRRKNDTADFWGCRNSDIKVFNSLVKKYVKLSGKDKSEKEQSRIMSAYRNDFCNYGVFRGTNAMGKILMLCKQCLHDNTVPDIDYELLRRKNIYINGERLVFDK